MKVFIILYVLGAPVDALGPYEFTLKECDRLLLARQFPECLPAEKQCKCEVRLDHSSLRQPASAN